MADLRKLSNVVKKEQFATKNTHVDISHLKQLNKILNRLIGDENDLQVSVASVDFSNVPIIGIGDKLLKTSEKLSVDNRRSNQDFFDSGFDINNPAHVKLDRKLQRMFDANELKLKEYNMPTYANAKRYGDISHEIIALENELAGTHEGYKLNMEIYGKNVADVLAGNTSPTHLITAKKWNRACWK